MINHLWQSTVFAAAAWLLTLVFRRNRAQVRYSLWLSASLKFLVPFSLLIGLGGHWTAPAVKMATPAVSIAIEQVTEPFPETVAFTPSPSHRRDWRPVAILIVWVCGAAAIAAMRLRGWLRIRAAVQASAPVEIPAPVEIRSAPGLLEPGVVGLFHPALLVPEGIAERLTPHQLEAVLAHELCHIRRRDNLTSAIHMMVEVLFWFHPLVWWIGARLVEERERACDEAVLSQGGEPHVYAEAILNVCKLYVESPLVCVSGVTGADLKRRIEAIMANRMGLRLNVAKKVALGIAGVVAIAAPMFIGGIKLRAQAPTPKFEAVSIRLCDGGAAGGTGKSGRGGGGGPAGSPDRLTLGCAPVRSFIRTAYVDFADGHFNPMRRIPVEGGPGWIDSERYQITAKAEGTPGQSMMRGPMLAAVLEERFQLKVRRESREVPAYALTVAKNGFKPQPFQEGSCVAFEFGKIPEPPGPGQKRPIFCSMRMLNVPVRGAPVKWQVHGASLDELATALGIDLDRIVINKTGITGRFDFYLEFSPDEATAGLNSLRGPDGPVVTPGSASDPPGGPSIFTAIQEQLGLKLESAKGPREFLVIDRVERPTEN
jgi:uncharacterized protein (TIGR03435 family)